MFFLCKAIENAQTRLTTDSVEMNLPKSTNVLFFCSGREYENLIMDCCQLEDGVTGVKREDTAGNDPENGSPDADRGGTKQPLI